MKTETSLAPNGPTQSTESPASDSNNWLRGVDLNHRPLGYEPNRTTVTRSETTGRKPRKTTKEPTVTRGFGPKLAPHWVGACPAIDPEEAESCSAPSDKLNGHETMIRNVLVDSGWYVNRGGWPDFLCSTMDRADNLHVMGVEVKDGYDEVTRAQQKMHHALSLIGIPVYVVRKANDPNWVIRDYMAQRKHPGPTRLEVFEGEEDWIG